MFSSIFIVVVLSFTFVVRAQPVFSIIDAGADTLDWAVTHYDGRTHLFSAQWHWFPPARLQIVELDPVTCQVKRNISTEPPYVVGIAADNLNRIYIGNQSAAVYQISERGDRLATFRADGTAGRYGAFEAWEVHVDRHYNVFAVFTNQHTVIKWNARGDVTLRINFTASEFLASVRVDYNDNIFVSVFGGQVTEIRKFNAEGRYLGVFASGTNTEFVITRDGDIFTAPDGGPMLRYNSEGTIIDRFDLPVKYTTAIAIDETVPGGTLYVALNEYTILKITHFLDRNNTTAE